MDDEDDEDLGPETDVDAADEVLMSPSLAAARALLLAGAEQETRQESPTPLAETEGESGEPALSCLTNDSYYRVDISCIVEVLAHLQQTLELRIVLVLNHSVSVLSTLHPILPFSSKKEGKVVRTEHPHSHFLNTYIK